MNTDTPRTDEAAVDVWRKSNGERMATSSDKVDADFARKLERELATVTAQRDRLAEALRKVSRSWNYVEVAQQALQSLTNPNANP
jgi:hypothetical protein